MIGSRIEYTGIQLAAGEKGHVQSLYLSDVCLPEHILFCQQCHLQCVCVENLCNRWFLKFRVLLFDSDRGASSFIILGQTTENPQGNRKSTYRPETVCYWTSAQRDGQVGRTPKR